MKMLIDYKIYSKNYISKPSQGKAQTKNNLEDSNHVICYVSVIIIVLEAKMCVHHA